jgi:beta-glucosidase/6-phospho-beta-glucosidase/beta-galactosidase
VLCLQGDDLPKFTEAEKALLKSTTIDLFSVNFYWYAPALQSTTVQQQQQQQQQQRRRRALNPDLASTSTDSSSSIRPSSSSKPTRM